MSEKRVVFRVSPVAGLLPDRDAALIRRGCQENETKHSSTRLPGRQARLTPAIAVGGAVVQPVDDQHGANWLHCASGAYSFQVECHPSCAAPTTYLRLLQEHTSWLRTGGAFGREQRPQAGRLPLRTGCRRFKKTPGTPTVGGNDGSSGHLPASVSSAA